MCVSVPPLTSPPLRPVLQDLTLGIRNISRFFGFQLTEEQVQRISEASTFRAMREKSNDSHAGMGKVFFRKGNTFKHPFPNCNAPHLGDGGFYETLSALGNVCLLMCQKQQKKLQPGGETFILLHVQVSHSDGKSVFAFNMCAQGEGRFVHPDSRRQSSLPSLSTELRTEFLKRFY